MVANFEWGGFSQLNWEVSWGIPHYLYVCDTQLYDPKCKHGE